MEMTFDFDLKEIPLKEIDFDFKDFNFSYPIKTKYFIELINAGKLFYPPLLYREAGVYLIIDGMARLSALKHQEVARVKALVLKESLSFRDLLLLSFELNLQRGLNLVEKALFVEKALKYFSKDEVLDLLPRLGFSRNQNWIFYFKRILSLEDPYKRLLSEEKLNPKIVEALSTLSSEERKEFLTLLEKLHLSFSEQREFLEILLDHKRLTQGEKFIPEELESALKIEDFNKRRKEALEIFYKLKFPNYHLKKEKIEKIKKYFLSLGIKFDFSPYLEKKELTLQLRVKSLEELKKALRFLENEGEKLFSLFE